MSEACIAKLEEEWEIAKIENDYGKLGKILRSLINFLKSIDGGVKEHEEALAEKTIYLESALAQMDFKTSLQVISDVRHARKSIRLSYSNFGSALIRKLSSSERARIRKRNRFTRLNLQTGVNGQEGAADRSDRSDFLDHDLDYDRIQRAGLGRLSETNSSFREEGGKEELKPLGRWKERLSATEIAAIEGTIGECLQECGYELSLPAGNHRSVRHSSMRGVYPAFLNSKLWLKLHTPLGRLSNMSVLELEEGPAPVVESVRL